MSEIKKAVTTHGTAKHIIPRPGLDLAQKKDLDGIKKALLFFIEREREKEMSDRLSHVSLQIWRSYSARDEYVNRIKKDVNKKYDALTKGLK